MSYKLGHMKFQDPTLIPSYGKKYGTLTAFVPPPLTNGVPKWLKQRVRERYKKSWIEKHGKSALWSHWELDALIQLVPGVSHPWFDHWGRAVYADKEFFVTEPYTLSSTDLKKILAFCEALDLEVYIHAGSAHYPTYTTRLMFLPKPEQDPPINFAQRAVGYETKEDDK